MVLKLLPRLFGKVDHVWVPTELKVFGKFCKRIHSGKLAVRLTYDRPKFPKGPQGVICAFQGV